MSTTVEAQSSLTPGKTRRSRSSTDKRRGRSRSPGAYLRKKGKSLKGFFKGNSDKASSRRLVSSLSKSTAPKEAPTANEPPAVITTTETKQQEDAFFGIEIDGVGSGGIKTSSSETEGEANKSEKTKEGQEIIKKDTASVTASSVSETASRTSEEVSQEPAQSSGLNTEEKIISNTVQIILLLMDPTSRRFELLELEYDSVKAIVQDLLSQIPSSATEESLRDQKYDGICTIGGEEMTCTGKLKDFVRGGPRIFLKGGRLVLPRVCKIQK